MPYRRETEQVLTDWRAVERHREDVEEGTPEALALYDEAGRLRREYQTLVGKAVARFRAAQPAYSVSSEPEPV